MMFTIHSHTMLLFIDVLLYILFFLENFAISGEIFKNVLKELW